MKINGDGVTEYTEYSVICANCSAEIGPLDSKWTVITQANEENWIYDEITSRVLCPGCQEEDAKDAK